MVCVFARKTSEPLTSLVKQIDSKIGENDKLKAFVVILSDKEDVPNELRKMAEQGGIKHVPLTQHEDPAEVPDYEISKKADVTVVMWRNGRVKAARGIQGALTEKDIDSILAEIPKTLND